MATGLITRVGGLIVQVYDCASVYGPVTMLLSVAWMLKLNTPVAVGVPLKRPEGDNVTPAGRVLNGALPTPVVTRKLLYGAVPPVTVINWL